MPNYLSPGVYVREVDSGSRPIEGVGTAVAAFVGMAGQGPVNEPTLVTNWTQFTTTFGEFIEGSYLAHAVYGYFMNGGGQAYIIRVGADGDGSASGIRAVGELPPADAEHQPPFRVAAVDPGPGGNDITVDVSYPEPQGEEEVPADQFNLTVRRGGTLVENFDRLTTRKTKNYAVRVVEEQSQTIRLEATASGVERPSVGSISLSGGNLPAIPTASSATDYIGDVAERTGLGGLETVDDVTMVAVPDLCAVHDRGGINDEQFKAVQLAMLTHCELMGDRMAILDTPANLNPQKVKTWRVDIAGYDSKFATVYWPRIKVLDPVSGQNIFVPPSGHIAGIWARNDDQRGVHKAPANEVVRGALSLEFAITRNEHDTLNPEGINCLRSFPGRGVHVWGARTLSSDPAWRYVNVRRLFNYLEKSILNNTDWVVFEPNDRNLWAKIRRTIASFLVMEWRKGALFGSTPAEAFFVKCDDETNPAEAIDLGQVTCKIGVAPVKPAEFVIFELAQLQGGISLVNE